MPNKVIPRTDGTSVTIPARIATASGLVEIPKAGGGSPIVINRAAIPDTSARVGESKPLLGKVAAGATLAFAFYDLYSRQGNPYICTVQKRPVGSTTQTSNKTFRAKNLISELEDFIGTGYDGFITSWFNQAPNEEGDVNGFPATKWATPNVYDAPKIVSNGSVVRDPQGKLAIDGKGARMKLLGKNSTQGLEKVLSSDGSFSLFLAGNFPSYSSAVRNNVQILNISSNTNGGAANPRKPFIAINKNFNKVGSSVGTFTIGGNTVGNVYGAYISGSTATEMITNIANPSKSTNNNMMWLDGVLRTSSNVNTVANTDQQASQHCFLFDLEETSVTTHVSSMVYYPNDQLSNVAAIHVNLLNQHDIT